jgi:intracellular sulfur oxidation DsrE/DsrF family protein
LKFAPRTMFAAGFLAAFALLAAAGAGFLFYDRIGASHANAASIPNFRAPSTDYGPQKVVYHVSTKGTWRDREAEAWRLVAVLNNHINAVEPDPLDLQVVFQGDGVDALRRAKANPRLAAAFDGLRQRGVKISVCANTLEAYKMSLETLYNVKEADLVQAAVAEFAHLQQRGYSYIKF